MHYLAVGPPSRPPGVPLGSGRKRGHHEEYQAQAEDSEQGPRITRS